jgi:trk system potassium uptake protein TrkA
MYVIIVGGGQVGTYLADLLGQGGHRIRVVEKRPELLERLRAALPADQVVAGSGTDPNLLESIGVRQADVLAAVTGQDETNLAAATLARFEFGVSRVIGRVNNPKNAWLFRPEMGVDVAINQADLIGHLIAEEMSLGDMMTLVKLRKGQYSVVEEKVDPQAPAAGKALRDLRFPERSVLAALIRKGELIIPRGETVLQAGDEVLAVVHASQAQALASLFGRPAQI